LYEKDEIDNIQKTADVFDAVVFYTHVKEKYVKFIREPAREDVSERIDLPLIIEYYSR